MISSITYSGDGANRIFPVSFEIKGEEYVAVFINGVGVSDKTKYDIINNSIVFIEEEAPVIGVGNVVIAVATTPSEIADLGAPPSGVQTVVDNLVNINRIVDEIIPNLAEILLADDNATIATTKASEALISKNSAEASALIATTQANIATTKAGEALTSANNADTSEANALLYSQTATTQAGIATTKAGEASTSATLALGYKNEAEGFRNEAEGFADSLDTTNFVNITTTQTIAGIKTFSSSPIVPTPTTATQVASKGYADGLFVSASETVAGKVELATNAEVQTGTDTTRAITPSGLLSAFANSKSANGYTKLPNGLIIQWGASSGAACGTNIALPITFSTVILGIYGNFYATNANLYGLGWQATLSTVIPYHSGYNAIPFKWLAIGY